MLLAMRIGCDLINEATRGTEQSLVVTASVASRTLFADNKDETNFGARVRLSVRPSVGCGVQLRPRVCERRRRGSVVGNKVNIGTDGAAKPNFLTEMRTGFHLRVTIVGRPEEKWPEFPPCPERLSVTSPFPKRRTAKEERCAFLYKHSQSIPLMHNITNNCSLNRKP